MATAFSFFVAVTVLNPHLAARQTALRCQDKTHHFGVYTHHPPLSIEVLDQEEIEDADAVVLLTTVLRQYEKVIRVDHELGV